MAEYKLFDGDTPTVSTFEFHEHRERAPHLEQAGHVLRLSKALSFVAEVVQLDGSPLTVSDLGCGDGGLLSRVQQLPGVLRAWGYDFQPSNYEGWVERGVNAQLRDVFGEDKDSIDYGSLTITTEVLEHLADPHEAVRRIGQHSDYLVASSPHDEHAASHDECHAWAWDMEGYAALVEQGGFRILQHEAVNPKFQVLMAVRS